MTHGCQTAAGAGRTAWVRWPVILLVLVTYVIPGLFSSYRAWVQIHSLELSVPDRRIGVGDTLRAHTVSWARAEVEVELCLIQGGHSTSLATHDIPRNHNASIDPRWRRDSITVVLTPRMLAGFDPGTATVAARAVGSPQWLRTPPPLRREVAVELAPDR